MPVRSRRRDFIGGTQSAGTKSRISAASVDRQSVVLKPETGVTALRPASNASRKATGEVPNADTTPSPVTTIARLIPRTLSSPPWGFNARRDIARLTSGRGGDDGEGGRHDHRNDCRNDRALRGDALWRDPGRHQPGARAPFDGALRRSRQLNRSTSCMSRGSASTPRSGRSRRDSPRPRPRLCSCARWWLAARWRSTRPSRVALRYTEPEQRTVLIDNNKLTVTWPTLPGDGHRRHRRSRAALFRRRIG